MGEPNGSLKGCELVNGAWAEHREQTSEIFERVNLMENALAVLTTNSEHLKILPEIKKDLLQSATGKNHVDTETFQMVVKYMGMVIIALLIILVFLLTGAQFGWIGPVHKVG